MESEGVRRLPCEREKYNGFGWGYTAKTGSIYAGTGVHSGLAFAAGQVLHLRFCFYYICGDEDQNNAGLRLS